MSVMTSVVSFFRREWVSYHLPRPLFHLGEIVQLADLYDLGHPWANFYYARIVSRKFDGSAWNYCVSLGHLELPGLPIPEKYLRKL